MGIDIDVKKLGYLNLEGFAAREEIDADKLKMSIVGLGQGGGKIAVEFNRLGHYVSLFNTCQEDLDDAQDKLKYINNTKYKVTKLQGYDGAGKDREIGLQAIKDNKSLIEKELVNDENLKTADFVWISVALGGGTGSGSVTLVSQIISSIIRKTNRIGIKKDRSGNITSVGKPTIGIIAAVPDGSSKHKMKLNAAKALKELKDLQMKKMVGTILLVDNEKLIKDFLDKDDKEVRNIDWVTYGNTTLAQILTELAFVTSLPGIETLDKFEMLDIWSHPGFLTLGKYKFGKEWKNDYKDANKLVESSFNLQNIFADGYDFDKAIHGGITILSSSRNDIITNKDKLYLKMALNNFLSNEEAEKTHYGVYDNDLFGNFKDIKNNRHHNRAEALMYTLAVLKQEPKSIIDMTIDAIEKEKARQEKSKQVDSLLIDTLDKMKEDLVVEKIEETSLDDLLGGGLYDSKEETKKENTLENLMDDYF